MRALMLLVLSTTIHAYDVNDIYYIPGEDKFAIEYSYEQTKFDVDLSISGEDFVDTSVTTTINSLNFGYGLSADTAIGINYSYEDSISKYKNDEFDAFDDSSKSFGFADAEIVIAHDFSKFDGENLGFRVYGGLSPNTGESRISETDKPGNSLRGGEAYRIGFMAGKQIEKVQAVLDWNKLNIGKTKTVGDDDYESEKDPYSISTLELRLRYDSGKNHFLGFNYSIETVSESVSESSEKIEESEVVTRLSILEYGYNSSPDSPFFFIRKGFGTVDSTSLDYTESEFTLKSDETSTDLVSVGLIHQF